MKRLFLLLIVLLLAGLGWLSYMRIPAPVQTIEQPIPADQVTGE